MKNNIQYFTCNRSLYAPSLSSQNKFCVLDYVQGKAVALLRGKKKTKIDSIKKT